MNRKGLLEARIKEIDRLLNELDEASDLRAKSLRDYNIGDNVVIKFRDIQLILKKESADLYKVVNNGNSQKLKVGDYLKLNDPNSTLEIGEKIGFTVVRPALNYNSDPIVSIN